uniref:AlNc14C209G8885 protein n=1 Tax=Albugo laibachii Nc14 TaxID=890382 RepID=F0WR78_9STRA|nr:AlNc14C209G8885 [Albugo laibachii Nc14]|eukprot:CCA23839.1 AlNc14C209G8885 [Albugo laibachii Nc14]
MKMQLIVLAALMAISSARLLKVEVLGQTDAAGIQKTSGTSSQSSSSGVTTKSDAVEDKGSNSSSSDDSKSDNHIHTPGDGHDHSGTQTKDAKHADHTQDTKDAKAGDSSPGGATTSSAIAISTQIVFSAAVGATVFSAFF